MKYFLHVIPITCLVIMAYFTYHAIYGHHGLLRLQKLNQKTSEAHLVLSDVTQQVTELKGKVVAIQKGAQDLIEEELLRVLNMGSKDDLVILTN